MAMLVRLLTVRRVAHVLLMDLVPTSRFMKRSKAITESKLYIPFDILRMFLRGSGVYDSYAVSPMVIMGSRLRRTDRG